MPRTRILIGGMTDLSSALAAAQAGADAIGFVFVPASARHIDPGEAWTIVRALPPLVSTVGLFVNASLETFSDIEEQCPTTYSQLHGSEPERLVRECGPGVIKAVRLGEAGALGAEVQRWGRIDEVDAILIDSAGGSPDWHSLAPALQGIGKPLVLGDMAAEAVGGAIRALRPFAVEASASLEREPGRKDPALIESFCQAVRAADGTR
jgi:phosphoribosylanthranilate isomerase